MKEVLDAEAIEDTPLIQFGRAERSGHKNAHNDALVITALLANYEVRRIFIVLGSSTDILFGEAYDQMQLGETLIEKVNTSLYGFVRSSTSMRHDLTSITSRDRIHSKDISSKILGGHTLCLQCYLGETHSQCFPSSNLQIPHEDQIFYDWRRGRNIRRPPPVTQMLCGGRMQRVKEE
ncbi:UNVERIFIED_CONTAM: hypothetical protein Sradi_6470500 [Sesamum radiatum]|uniref:Uncharacterized protein n=1 Tax=Sesamum radiatum TaxID=300843 RepID=A0AAW2K5A8_SESRA